MKRNLDLSNPAALAAALSGDLQNALVASTPGGIEAQEAEGQRSMVAAGNKIPKDGADAVSKALGITLGADADDLFVYAELPTGWKIQASDHSMWSYLYDESGKKRAAIFYKAAFYDRHAHISLEKSA